MSVTAPPKIVAAVPYRRLQQSFGCFVADIGNITLCSFKYNFQALKLGETFPVIGLLFHKCFFVISANPYD